MSRVLEVNEVTVAWLGMPTSVPILSALGRVNSGGWTRPRLEPWLYITVPADGIQDFDFVADPPQAGSTVILPLLPIVAGYVLRNLDDYWGKGKPLKGVRVHSSTNSKEADVDTGVAKEAQALSARGDDNPYPLARSMAAIFGGDAHPWPWDDLRDDKDELNSLRELLVGHLVRFYYTGSPLTMDYIPFRINVEISPATHRVVSISKG